VRSDTRRQRLHLLRLDEWGQSWRRLAQSCVSSIFSNNTKANGQKCRKAWAEQRLIIELEHAHAPRRNGMREENHSAVQCRCRGEGGCSASDRPEQQIGALRVIDGVGA
jgi:hypothetical protein